MEKSRIICMVFVIAALLAAGCTSPQVTPAPATAPPTSFPAETPATVITTDTVPPTPVTVITPVSPAPDTTTAETPAPSATPTRIPKAYGRDAADEPQIASLTFVKECFIFDVPDCGMRAEFPEIAGDPDYGIRQPVPKLAMIPDDRISAFLKKYAGDYADDPGFALHVDANTIGGTACAGASGSPKWNFVRINATLNPRNARPGEYDIGINVRSHGVIIEQLRMNATFAIDRQVVFSRYIPLTLDETDDFDSIEMVFARRTQ